MTAFSAKAQGHLHSSVVSGHVRRESIRRETRKLQSGGFARARLAHRGDSAQFELAIMAVITINQRLIQATTVTRRVSFGTTLQNAYRPEESSENGDLALIAPVEDDDIPAISGEPLAVRDQKIFTALKQITPISGGSK